MIARHVTALALLSLMSHGSHATHAGEVSSAEAWSTSCETSPATSADPGFTASSEFALAFNSTRTNTSAPLDTSMSQLPGSAIGAMPRDTGQPNVRSKQNNALDDTGSAKPPEYEIIDLGTFDGPLANAHAINDQGQVVGTAEPPDEGGIPFLWEDGTMTHLGTIMPGETQFGGIARAISPNGLVVGSAMAPYPGGSGATVGHAFLWTAEDGMIDLTPDSLTLSVAWGVNSSGQVVGQIGGGAGGAFIWSAEDGFNVIDFPNAMFNSNQAEDINENGLVIGHARNLDAELVGWVYDSKTGDIWELPHLEIGGTQTRAINDAGDISGYSRLSNNQQRPVVWTHDGEIIDLGFLPVPNYSQGVANDLNEQRWVIGADYYDGSGVPSKGWLWLGGEKFELLSLISDPEQRDEWMELSTPLGINNHGEIVGIGIREGLPGRAFLMRPLIERGDLIFTDDFQATDP